MIKNGILIFILTFITLVLAHAVINIPEKDESVEKRDNNAIECLNYGWCERYQAQNDDFIERIYESLLAVPYTYYLLVTLLYMLAIGIGYWWHRKRHLEANMFANWNGTQIKDRPKESNRASNHAEDKRLSKVLSEIKAMRSSRNDDKEVMDRLVKKVAQLEKSIQAGHDKSKYGIKSHEELQESGYMYAHKVINDYNIRIDYPQDISTVIDSEAVVEKAARKGLKTVGDILSFGIQRTKVALDISNQESNRIRAAIESAYRIYWPVNPRELPISPPHYSPETPISELNLKSNILSIIEDYNQTYIDFQIQNIGDLLDMGEAGLEEHIELDYKDIARIRSSLKNEGYFLPLLKQQSELEIKLRATEIKDLDIEGRYKTRIANALSTIGITNLYQLMRLPKDTLHNLPNLGGRSIAVIEQQLEMAVQRKSAKESKSVWSQM